MSNAKWAEKINFNTITKNITGKVNFILSLVVSRFTAPPPEYVQQIVEDIRIPKGSGDAIAH